MRYSTKVAVAIHILCGIAYFHEETVVTSDFLARSIGISSAAVRKVFLQLKDADLIRVKRGTGGASLLKSPNDISVYDIYMAVEEVEEPVFHIHETMNYNCPLGRQIGNSIENEYKKIEDSMYGKMKQIYLSDFLNDIK